MDVTVKQNEEKPIEKEILAESIVRISDAFRKLQASGLNRRAIVVLLRDRCGSRVSMTEIETVLDALSELKQRYCRPEVK